MQQTRTILQQDGPDHFGLCLQLEQRLAGSTHLTNYGCLLTVDLPVCAVVHCSAGHQLLLHRSHLLKQCICDVDRVAVATGPAAHHCCLHARAGLVKDQRSPPAVFRHWLCIVASAPTDCNTDFQPRLLCGCRLRPRQPGNRPAAALLLLVEHDSSCGCVCRQVELTPVRGGPSASIFVRRHAAVLDDGAAGGGLTADRSTGHSRLGGTPTWRNNPQYCVRIAEPGAPLFVTLGACLRP